MERRFTENIAARTASLASTDPFKGINKASKRTGAMNSSTVGRILG